MRELCRHRAAPAPPTRHGRLAGPALCRLISRRATVWLPSTAWLTVRLAVVCGEIARVSAGRCLGAALRSSLSLSALARSGKGTAAAEGRRTTDHTELFVSLHFFVHVYFRFLFVYLAFTFRPTRDGNRETRDSRRVRVFQVRSCILREVLRAATLYRYRLL